MSTEKTVSKIRQCLDYQSLNAMEKDFNGIGLTMQTTSNNRIILCRIQNNKPVAKKIIDDYIFVGDINTLTNEISDSACQKIIDWVLNHAGKKSEVKNIARAWRNGLRMYESSIVIMNEDIHYIGSLVSE